MKPHLSTDELIEEVYGLSGHAHLKECPACAARLRRMEAVRHQAARPGPVSEEFLAAQRRGVYARIAEPAAHRLRWLPALAAAAVLAVVALVHMSTPPVAHPDSGDEQLFSEVYSMEQSSEPQAAAPIHELFDESGQ